MSDLQREPEQQSQRTRNRFWNWRRSIDENLTGCLQGNAALGYERNPKHLFSNLNNTMSQIIFKEQNLDFHHRMGEIWRQSMKCPDQRRASTSCRKNNFSFEQLDVQ
jgi:hypothetical protein